METVQQNGRFTLFSSKFLSIYSILYDCLVGGLSVSPFSAIMDVSPSSICKGDNFVSGLGVELKC